MAADRPSLGDTARDIVRGDRDRTTPRCDDALDAARAGATWPTRCPADLSQGQRKLVGVARALAASPRLVCMDEPAAGLDTAESEELGPRLRAIVDAGMTILLVDHDMGLVLGVCDYVYVLEFGKEIAEGTPDEVTRDPEVDRGVPRRGERRSRRGPAAASGRGASR